MWLPKPRLEARCHLSRHFGCASKVISNALVIDTPLAASLKQWALITSIIVNLARKMKILSLLEDSFVHGLSSILGNDYSIKYSNDSLSIKMKDAFP